MEGIRIENGQPVFAEIGAVATNQTVEGMPDHTWQKAYDLVHGQTFRPKESIYSVGSIVLGILAEDDHTNHAMQHLGDHVGFIPVANEDVQRFQRHGNQYNQVKLEVRQAEQELEEYHQQIEQLKYLREEEEAKKAASLDDHAVVAELPPVDADSHNGITKDELRTNFQGSIELYYAGLKKRLLANKARALNIVEQKRQASLIDLGEEGEAAAGIQSSEAAKSTERRLASHDEHLHNAAINKEFDAQRDRVNEAYDKSLALAEKLKLSAHNAIDKTTDEDGSDIVRQLEQALTEAAAATAEIETLTAANEKLTAQVAKQDTTIKELGGKVQALELQVGEQNGKIGQLQASVNAHPEALAEARAEGASKGQLQRNLAIAGMLVMTLVALGLGVIVMRGSGHTPIENFFKALSPQQLKNLEYIAIGAIAIGGLRAGYVAMKKGVPAVKRGIENVWSKVPSITIST